MPKLYIICFFYKENVIKHIEAQVNRKAKNTFYNYQLEFKMPDQKRVQEYIRFSTSNFNFNFFLRDSCLCFCLINIDRERNVLIKIMLV